MIKIVTLTLAIVAATTQAYGGPPPWEATPNDFNAIYNGLQNYQKNGGPLWDPVAAGSTMNNAYNNKPIPPGARAVPCQPPGKPLGLCVVKN